MINLKDTRRNCYKSTENKIKFANCNQITPDEICEDFKSGDYKARKVILVNYGYRNSVEEDMFNWSQMFESPTISKCNSVFQEITENISNATYKKNVKIKRMPQLQNSGEWQDVPLLKITSHRKSTKKKTKKICVKKTKTNSAGMVTKWFYGKEANAWCAMHKNRVLGHHKRSYPDSCSIGIQLLLLSNLSVVTATFAVLTNLMILIIWQTFKREPPDKAVLIKYIMALGSNPQKILQI